MEVIPGRPPGITLVTQVRRAANIDRIAAWAVGVIALVLGTLALLAGISGTVYHGVTADSTASTIQSVLPGSFAWNAGVRAGQDVVRITASDEPGGWSITTSGEGGEHTANAVERERLMRQLWIACVGSLGLALTALFVAGRSARSAQALAAAAIALSAIPLYVAAYPPWSSVAPPLAVVVTFIWLARWQKRHRPLWLGLAVATIGVAIAWSFAGVTASDAYNLITPVMWLTAATGSAVMIGTLVRSGWVEAGSPNYRRRLVIDSGAVAFAVVVAAALVLANTPAILAIAIAGVLLVAFILVRRSVRGFVDAFVIGDARERAAVEALESERARVARDIHDAPLQELAGVIKRLELTPQNRAEGDALRGVADQLRTMATDLYPALLEDWGLVAAIEHEARRLATNPAVELLVEVTDLTAVTPDRRPPAAVALAAYRVVHEAVANALAHSHGHVVHVAGSVAPGAIDITVRDDGVGISDEARREALDAGHFGLSSMHNRAEAVGASMDIASTSDGTRVRLVWPA